MQNASKMLIMAASVLIGIFIISVFVYLFRIGASTNQKYDERQSEAQLELYNNKFLTYNVQDNTIMDILSVINLAYNTNIDTNYDEGWAVKIDIIIGGKKFQISNTKESNPQNELKRNEIYFGNKVNSDLVGGKKIPVYDLTEKTIKDLVDRVTGGKLKYDYDDTLSKTRFGRAQKYGIDGNPLKDQNGNPIFVDDATIYKFLFKCISSEIKYHEVTGRIAYMKFEIYNNSEY